ncbi:MAG TPA: YhjD/YihY/BrkB family envelope integrity protein [Myxococcaceae bacterium]|nr:YhjD/YihY/BrkB family envelope integrity protein [Myxococcaceae bacterium]
MPSRGRRPTRDRLKSTLVHTGQTLRTIPGGRFAADTMSAMRALVHGFRGENISLRASALTYATIFSLVPMLTVALAILQGLHQEEFQARVRGFVQELLAPGIREDTGALLERFISRANGMAAGWIGFTVLAITAGALLRNLDGSLNEIWNVRRDRKLWHRILIYTVILLLGPLMVAITLAGSSELRSAVLHTQLPYTQTLVALFPWLASIFAFTLLYKLAPAAAVRVRSAFAGGLMAGLGWQLAQRAYAAFGAQIFRFNPIYGSLGAAPLFLSWIYVSWILVLFGARLAYAVEHASYLRVYGHLGDTPRTRELIAAQIAHQVTLAHYKGQPAPTARDLARKLDVPLELAGYLVDRMKRARLLSEVGRAGLVPARPPEELSVADASRAVGGMGSLPPLPLDPDKAAEFQHVDRLFRGLDQEAAHALERVMWTDLIAERTQPNGDSPEDAPQLKRAGGTRRNP